MKALFDMLSRYNCWANSRVFEAVALLPPEKYREDRGVFFRSIEGTLNHLMVTDHIWMQRVTGGRDALVRLDELLFKDFSLLRHARCTEDAKISSYVAGLDVESINSVIKYRRASTSEEFAQPVWMALAHWFNHQTHHRGQVHGVLTGIGGKAPELDLLYFQREEALPFDQKT